MSPLGRWLMVSLVLTTALPSRARAAGPNDIIPAGSKVLIEVVDWSDKLASPYLGKKCVAMNELWPAGFNGDLSQGRIQCGNDVFSATAVKLKVLDRARVPADDRYQGEALMSGTAVKVLSFRDLVTPPLAVGARCRVAKGPAKRVGPGHLRAWLQCDGVMHEAYAVALAVLDAAPSLQLGRDAPELGCVEGKWRDCVRASVKHLDEDDGPWLEAACEVEDPHACRDYSRWVSAYQRGQTRRELELQERACQLGSQLACFERARARNHEAEMIPWCEQGFAPACRFLQLLWAHKPKDAAQWKAKACAEDAGCGSY